MSTRLLQTPAAMVSALKGFRVLVFSLLLLSATSSQASDAPTSARDNLETFSSGLATLQADFTQLIISADGQILERGAGQVWISQPNLFRWSYDGEFPELIVADGEQVWMYDEALEQVTVRSQSGLVADSPLTLLMDMSGIDEQFRVAELGDVAGIQLLELTSPDMDAQFERVLLGWRDNQLDTMVLEDAFGMRTEMVFANVKRNPVLGPDLFSFTPPEGVDVVGDLPTPEPINGAEENETGVEITGLDDSRGSR